MKYDGIKEKELYIDIIDAWSKTGPHTLDKELKWFRFYWRDKICGEDKICVTDSIVIIFINKEDFLLNADKVWEGFSDLDASIVNNLMSKEPTAKHAIGTERNNVFVVNVSGSSEEITVDYNHLRKYFYLTRCVFRGIGPTQPVFIYADYKDYNPLIGCILPFVSKKSKSTKGKSKKG